MKVMKSSVSYLLGAIIMASSLGGCGTSAYQIETPQLFNGFRSQQPIFKQFSQNQNALENRVLIGYKDTLTPQKIKQLEQRYKLQFIRDIEQINVAVFQSTNARGVMNLVQNDPIVTFAGVDQSPRRITTQVQEVQVLPNQGGQGDPLKAEQWSLKAVDAEKAWEVTRGSKDVVVAVVDTGVDLNHPDLKANLTEGYNAENPGSPPQDGHYHGTHVAGIVAAVADNGEGVTGIAPNVRVMPVRTISNGGVAEVADGIVWATDHGANVINLSLGWDYPSSSVEETIKRAMKYAMEKNVVVCAAMSNSSRYNPRSTPDNLAGQAGFEGVIAVGNIDNKDRRNGAPGEWKSVSSPGTEIISTLPDNRYGKLTGTSMATPMVSGIVALVLSQNQAMSNAEIKQHVMGRAVDLGDTGFDNDFGAGRINAFKVLSDARVRFSSVPRGRFMVR